MERLITVQGKGENAAPPDTCHIDFRVWAAAPTVAEATARMSSASRDVIAALTSGGADRVSTARFSIRTHHDHQGRPAGFQAETAVRAVVTLEEGSGDAVSGLLGAAVDAGGDSLALDAVDDEDDRGADHQRVGQAERVRVDVRQALDQAHHVVAEVAEQAGGHRRQLGRQGDAALGDQRAQAGERVGVDNVRRRLIGHYGETATLTLVTEASGSTVAEISMPLLRQDDRGRMVENAADTEPDAQHVANRLS